MEPADPRPHVTKSVQCDGYVRHRVEIHTEAHVVMPMYVLVPDGLKEGERRPAMIAAHGHDGGGKVAVVGRDDIPSVAEAISRYNYDYGRHFAQKGLVVFAPDARSHGERREQGEQGHEMESFIHSRCYSLHNRAICLGQSVVDMWTFDLMRLIDYIQTRPECDPDRIGCGGLSGGGLQTLWLAALDDRIKATIVSGYFHGYLDAELERNNCACSYVPGLWQAVDKGDIGALIAPRPFLIETGERDRSNGSRGLENVTKQVDITRQAYALLGAEDALVHDIWPGGHKWYAELSEPWMVEQLTSSG